MQVKTHRQQFAAEICKALGIDTNVTRRLVLDFEAGDTATVTVYQLRLEDDELVEVVRRFTLHATSIDEANGTSTVSATCSGCGAISSQRVSHAQDMGVVWHRTGVVSRARRS